MKSMFSFICCGSVDDGKSTLIGRLLLDTGNVKKDQLDEARKSSLKNGADKVELAFLLDGLLAEREQQITIDVAHRYFDYDDIRFHILDCPGHEQYTKNMAIAAAVCDTAIVVIDCTRGIQPQTRRHIEICDLFHVQNLVICLTKCDLIFNDKSKPDFETINNLKDQLRILLKKYNFEYNIIPVSAVTGYNMDCVLKQICDYAELTREKIDPGTILHIQSARLYEGKRYYYGRNVFNGDIRIGSGYTLYPQNQKITVTKVPSLECIQIEEKVDIAQGDCVADIPVMVANRIFHKTIWFDQPSGNMLLKHGSRIAKIVSYTENELELDVPLIFNNIEDVKENGFAVIIDSVSKKTIGCSVFTGNQSMRKQKEKPVVYDCRKLKKNEKKAKIAELKERHPLGIIVLEEEKLEPLLSPRQDCAIEKMAELLSEQGFYVAII